MITLDCQPGAGPGTKVDPEVKQRLRTGRLPRLHREGIWWRTVGPIVEISIELVNQGPGPTASGFLNLGGAMFGAFVPFKPLGRAAVPALGPGERREVRLRVERERLDRLNPQFLRDKLGELGATEWAGNLNVFFDGDPAGAVEVHRALDLNLKAGERTAVCFFLLAGRPPRSSERPSLRAAARDFEISATWDQPGWDIDLGGASYSAPAVGRVPAPDINCAVAVVQAPAEPGLQARVRLDITRLEDRKTVPVEFGFTSVEGEATRLGCRNS